MQANKITREDTDCTLQQTYSEDYTIITVTTDNGAPRQQHIEVLYLTIVQLVWTSKQITVTTTDCALQKIDNTK